MTPKQPAQEVKRFVVLTDEEGYPIFDYGAGEVVHASDYDALLRELQTADTYPGYKREKALRCQAEAERDALQQRVKELEARLELDRTIKTPRKEKQP